MILAIIATVVKYLLVSVFVYESYKVGRSVNAKGFQEHAWNMVQALLVTAFFAFVFILKSSFSEYTGYRSQTDSIEQFVEALLVLYIPYLIGILNIS